MQIEDSGLYKGKDEMPRALIKPVSMAILLALTVFAHAEGPEAARKDSTFTIYDQGVLGGKLAADGKGYRIASLQAWTLGVFTGIGACFPRMERPREIGPQRRC